MRSHFSTQNPHERTRSPWVSCVSIDRALRGVWVTHAIDAGGGDTTEPRLTLDGELIRRITAEDCFFLMRVLEWVAAARDGSEVCAALVERGIGARAVAVASLASVHAARGELKMLARAGTPRALRRRSVPLSSRSVMTDAARDDAIIEVPSDREVASRYGSDVERVLVAVPLRASGSVVGVLGIRFGDGPALTAADRALLRLLGARMGPTLARLIDGDEERARADRLESASKRLHGMARIARDLAEAGLDERQLLERAARGVAETFGDACLVRMLVDGSRLETVAVHHADARAREDLERFAERSAEEPARKSLSSGRGVLLRRVHRRASGTPVRKSLPTSSIMSAPIELAGAACGVILAVRERGTGYGEEDRLLLEDVSYRVGLALAAARAFAAEQEARVRAEHAARGRDRVLSTVSHDLRAPLATVHLGASLLADLDRDHDAFTDVVARITRATQRMRRLVEDLLDLGQLESGMLRVKCYRVSLRRVLEETVDELAERARRANKELACATDVPPIEVLGDFERIQQVLVNLVANAIDHTPAGTWIVLGADEDGERAWISVEDDGPGLDPGLAEHLFEPHVRGASAVVRGAGLGLWIAKGLVEAHGGELRVATPKGKGTRFELSLPIAQRE